MMKLNWYVELVTGWYVVVVEACWVACWLLWWVCALDHSTTGFSIVLNSSQHGSVQLPGVCGSSHGLVKSGQFNEGVRL